MSASIGLSPETCAKKRRYRTSKDAKAARRSLMAHAGSRELSVFRCEHCAGWHLGNRPPWAGGATAEPTVPDVEAPE